MHNNNIQKKKLQGGLKYIRNISIFNCVSQLYFASLTVLFMMTLIIMIMKVLPILMILIGAKRRSFSLYLCRVAV